MRQIVIMAGALLLAWLLWSGLYKPLLLSAGVLSVLLTVWLAQRMNLLRRDIFALGLMHRLPGFWAWLLKELVESNLRVARVILSPSLPISPTLIRLSPAVNGPIGRATVANSITLTPGTLTIDARGGAFLVHCLTEYGAEELREDRIGRRVLRVLGDR